MPVDVALLHTVASVGSKLSSSGIRWKHPVDEAVAKQALGVTGPAQAIEGIVGRV